VWKIVGSLFLKSVKSVRRVVVGIVLILEKTESGIAICVKSVVERLQMTMTSNFPKIEIEYYPYFFSINDKMDYITNTFQDDIKSEFILYYADCIGNHLEDEENMERFLEEAYNTFTPSPDECKDFINNNLNIYLEMEAFCKDYYEDELGDVWTGGGIVRVVSLWKYLFAEDYLRKNYEEIIEEALAEDE
jgi:hypothetical protein